MTLTEDEAKTRWCPMFNRAGNGGNTDADGGRRPTCIASQCMMWQRTKEIIRGRETGYCGLARSVVNILQERSYDE